MSSVATRARKHYRAQQRIALRGVRAVRRAVRAASTPKEAADKATTQVAIYQLAAALGGSKAIADEAGRDRLSNPAAFAGTTQLGWPIETPVDTIIDRLVEGLGGELDRLTESMMAPLDLFVQSEVIASGADAASVEIAAGPEWTNYVRVLVLPSCDRCVILAGRIYRDLEGFPRHPKCDCQHWPVSSWAEAEAAGLVTAPMVAFEKGLIGGYRVQKDGSLKFESSLSKADTQAIRDGADIQEVVNAKRGGGRRPKGMTNIVSAEIFGRTVKATLEGTTKRAVWRKKHPDLPIRLRPESIYEHAKDRDDAIRLLKLYGYLRHDEKSPNSAEPLQGGASGSPPRPPTPPTPSAEPDPPDDGDQAEWRRRQEALGIPTNGEQLKPDEVRFVERFQQRGQRIIEWLGRDEQRRLKTNDFVWAFTPEDEEDADSGALAIELKSPKARYSTIANAIRADAPVKENFIVDLGRARLTDKLRRQLGLYNQRNPEHTARRLWVLSNNGAHFDEIQLQ